MASAALPPDGRGTAPLRRLVPLAILLVLVLLFVATGLHRWLSLAALREHHAMLAGLVASRPVLAALTFMLLYAGIVALSVPGAAALTLAGGFLFGSLPGTALVVVGATAGAVAVFLIARTALGETLQHRAGPWLARMEGGFAENALSYLLVLRLIPLFPFFIVNIVPALLGVRLRTYAIGTLLGIIPGTYVYATVGAGLGSVFMQGREVSLEGVLTPEIVTGLIGLAVLALLPVAYKRWARRKGSTAS